MTQEQVFDLPFPPSVNGLYRNARGRGRVKTDRYAAWINSAGWALKAHRNRSPVKGRVVLHIMYERKDRRKRDLSNLVKAVEDLLVAHKIIEDDSLVEQLSLAWSDHITGCRVCLSPYQSTLEMEAAE